MRSASCCPRRIDLDGLEFGGAAQPAKQRHGQARETGSAAEVVAEGLAGELLGEVGAGFMAADGLDRTVEEEINR